MFEDIQMNAYFGTGIMVSSVGAALYAFVKYQESSIQLPPKPTEKNVETA